MAFQNDVVAYDAAGQLVLVVEVKTRRGTTGEWAAATRQLLLRDELVANAPYFLLALPDRFYLWVNHPKDDLIAPDYSIDPLPFLNPYFGMSGIPGYLTGIDFEMIVKGWLATLTWATKSDDLPATSAASGDWLIKSGLFDAMKQGQLTSEVTA